MIEAANSGMTIFAIVSLSALLGSAFFVWRAVRRLLRFWRYCRRNSVKAAIMRSRQAAHRQAYRCATDQPYFSARLALLFCANLLAVAAVLFGSIAIIARPSERFFLSVAVSQRIEDVLLLLFLAFAGRAFYRTVRLSRKVMEIRRKLRTVALRKAAGAHPFQ